MHHLIDPQLVPPILHEARRAGPREVCGLLLGGDAIERHQPLPNVAQDPHAFAIDPLAYARTERLLLQHGTRVLGIYHSHPLGRPEPSPSDRDLLWADACGLQLIISLCGAWNLWRPGRTWRSVQSGRVV